ncbi:MAG: hypothetical protein KDH93_09100 [Rhodoferax sp.]|nr:hypothetical protein [Rhodoferax sp.]
MPANLYRSCAAALAMAGVLGTPAVRAEDTAFVRSCQTMVAQASIRVVFEDAVLARDNTRSLDELKALSRQSSGPYHQVYGLTQAQAGARYAVRAAMLAHADGRVCAVPSLEVTISVTGLTVYLARELGANACKRAIVDEHEQEHVAVWRNHLRAGARLLEPILRQRLDAPFMFASAQEVKDGFRGRVDAVLNPLLRQLQDGIVAANRQIDSPQSYQATGQRLMACP